MESFSIRKSKNIFVIPGNPGIAQENKVILSDIKNPSISKYVQFAKDNEIDLTIVGPEAL